MATFVRTILGRLSTRKISTLRVNFYSTETRPALTESSPQAVIKSRDSVHSFNPATIGATLKTLLNKCENGNINASQISHVDLRNLSESIEKWTHMRFVNERQPSDWQAILRAQATLSLPISPQLTDNARQWLRSRFSNFTNDSLLTVAQLAPLLEDFRVMGAITFPGQFNRRIVNSLVKKTTEEFHQLTADDCVAVVEAVDCLPLALKPDKAFWRCLGDRLGNLQPVETHRLTMALRTLIGTKTISDRMAQGLIRKSEAKFSLSSLKCGPQAWFHRQVGDVFKHLATLLAAMSSHNNRMLPTVQSWNVFRKRLTVDSFRPDEHNWPQIAQTVAQIVNSRNLTNEGIGGEKFLLPPHWYTILLELALQRQPADPDIFKLFQLLSAQCIQFDDDLQTKAASLCERHCMATDNFAPTLWKALKLGLPVSQAQWKRVIEIIPQLKSSELTGLMESAAYYWALRLPGTGTPPPQLLHYLVLEHLLRNPTYHWRKLSTLLGDEFMPQKWLQRQHAKDKTPELTVLGGKLINKGSKLGARFSREYGAVKILEADRLQKMGGCRVRYLLTKADGSETVLMRDTPEMHYWRMPADVQGGPTVRARVLAYLAKRAGYEFVLANRV